MEIIIYDVEKICRSCLKEQNEMISVFKIDDEFGNNKICDIIKTLTNIEVSFAISFTHFNSIFLNYAYFR